MTNKTFIYNVTATPNKTIDCTGGKELFLEIKYQQLTTAIPQTNSTWTFSTGASTPLAGSTNREVFFVWATTGSSTDTAYKTYTTNVSILGRPYVNLDSCLPLATLTNATVKYMVK